MGGSSPDGGWSEAEITRRWNTFVSKGLTEEDIPRVDGAAIGSLTGEALNAVSEGRRRGMANDPAIHPRSPAVTDDINTVENAMDNMISTGFRGTPSAAPDDPMVSTYLDETLADPTPAKVTMTQWWDLPAEQSDAKDTRVSDLPDIATVKAIHTGLDFEAAGAGRSRCKCSTPEKHTTPVTFEPARGEDPTFQARQRLEEAAMKEIAQNPSGLYRQREGDQPLPEVNDTPFIHDEVAKDLMERKEVGVTRYGTGLQAFNGRNSAQDAYEEVLDLSVYLKQFLIEREVMANELRVAQDLIRDIDLIVDDDYYYGKAKEKIRAIREELRRD